MATWIIAQSVIQVAMKKTALDGAPIFAS